MPIFHRKMSSSVLFLPQERWIEIVALCEQGYPHEACGILVGRRQTVQQIFPAKNLNQERAQDRYELDPNDFKKADETARQQGLEIIGFYHSHPDHPPDASKMDIERAWEGYCYLIVSVLKGRLDSFKTWHLNKGKMIEEKLEVTHGES